MLVVVQLLYYLFFPFVGKLGDNVGSIIGAHFIELFGFGDGFDCPDSGRLLSDPGYGAKMWKPHSVSSAATAHCVIRADFLKLCLPELVGEAVSINMLGPWIGALASEAGKRIVYSPFMRARAGATSQEPIAPDARAHFLSRFWPLIPDSRVYSPRLGLDPARTYEEVDPNDNLRHCAALQVALLPYPRWLEMRIRRRVDAHPVPERSTGVTLITTVYEGTRIDLLDALAASVTGQTVKAAQWVIVAHGPLAARDINHIVGRSALWAATVVIEPSALGIMGAMRRGLDNALGEYIVPVDADDVLTPDAIQILTSTIAKHDRPDLIFSDEDMLVEDHPASPYLRSAFDPVLNLDSSYIWHLCAINRERAVALALYTDPQATWCHDWDSIIRVWNAGGRIQHVPEILYHWRQHTNSTTNNAQGDSRSLDSIRHILERQIARTPDPTRFHVAEWPEYRGAKELYIARGAGDLPPFIWIGDAVTDTAACHDDAILVVAGNGVLIESQQVFSEVARLLELHPGLGAVGGLVANKDGTVVDACSMVNRTGRLESPWTGHASSFGGSYALALKTQTVAATGLSLGFFRISALKRSGAWPLRATASVSEQITQLCNRLTAGDWTIAFSPLIRGRAETAGNGARTRHPAGPTADASALVKYGTARSFRL